MSIDWTSCRLAMGLAAGALLAVGVASHGRAEEGATSPADPPVSRGAEAAHQVEAEQSAPDWHLDPAIFIDLSPMNAPEVAIKLPEDQRERQ